MRIAYATSGIGAPIVKAANWLSHLEFDGSSPVWLHLLRELSRSNTLVRYDARGSGLSDSNAEISFAGWVRDLENVVEASGSERFPCSAFRRAHRSRSRTRFAIPSAWAISSSTAAMRGDVPSGGVRWIGGKKPRR